MPRETLALEVCRPDPSSRPPARLQEAILILDRLFLT